MWSQQDAEWLLSNYPGLRIQNESDIAGEITFQVLVKDRLCQINPTKEQISQSVHNSELYICDSYKVRISRENSLLPKVFEVGGRIAEVAKCKGKSLLDMHQFQDGGLCLASPIEVFEAFFRKFEIEVLINDFVIPYLAAQSYFSKKGVWLFGELSHGITGVLEWLAHQDQSNRQHIKITLIYLGELGLLNEIVGKRPRGHDPCICGKKKKMRDCHPEAMKGILILRNARAQNIHGNDI